ncbi:DUF6296 family protein [Actinacidiphila soli]|jgi:hypothetical protein|uniref:DUF6296 family protein n=1 Tax=Actinacidiphila soli TaxID=2487275 RepID=UPI000FCA0820|nr:DUF6296 family protein [Actinacidiphila soli]
MGHAKSFELTFPASGDTVVVIETERKGAGGYPVYADDTGIVQAEISDRGEVRMLASGGHQSHDFPSRAVARS